MRLTVSDEEVGIWFNFSSVNPACLISISCHMVQS